MFSTCCLSSVISRVRLAASEVIFRGFKPLTMSSSCLGFVNFKIVPTGHETIEFHRNLYDRSCIQICVHCTGVNCRNKLPAIIGSKY